MTEYHPQGTAPVPSVTIAESELQQEPPSSDATEPSHPMTIPENLITRRELAQILKVSEHCLSVRRKELEAVLPMVKLNDRVIRYRMSDVQKLIDRGGLL